MDKPFLLASDGQPLQLLHGSRCRDFDRFCLSKATTGSGCASGRLGVFLTDSPDNARYFADPDSGAIVVCRVRMENPLCHDCEADGYESPASVARRAQSLAVDAYLAGDDTFVEHDGVVVRNVLDGSHYSTVYIVFDPDDVDIVAFIDPTGGDHA